jgi:hypothetical protein
VDPGSAVTPSEFRASVADLPTTLEGVAALPVPALPVDRWARWLLVALHRHIERQRWVGEVVVQSLHLDLARLARGEHGERDHGQVPGLEGWSYLLHGIGCCLTQTSGLTLDVDFPGGLATVVDPGFYDDFLASQTAPERIERAFSRHPSLRHAWRIDLEPLWAAGLLAPRAYRLSLSEDGAAWAAVLAEAFEQLEGAADPVQRAAIAARLGDPLLALEVCQGLVPLPNGVAPQGALLEKRCAALLDARAEWLRASLDAEVAVEALGLLGRARAEAPLCDVLRTRPLDLTLRAAVDVVASWQDVTLSPLLLSVLERSIGLDGVAPALRVLAAQRVMELQGPSLANSVRARLIAALDVDVVAQATAGEVGLLLSLLDGSLGFRRLSAALASEVPMARTDAAAALSILGQGGSLTEEQRWAVPFLAERFERLLARWRPGAVDLHQP